jgi:hypothetical protein
VHSTDGCEKKSETRRTTFGRGEIAEERQCGSVGEKKNIFWFDTSSSTDTIGLTE